MSRKRLLDLFGCQGGACKGYQQAGFHVTSIDRDPQPRNPADEFVQADALEFLEDNWQDFDAIHASPPCQTHSALAHFATPGKYVDLIPQTRELLMASGKPYVIENVAGAKKALIDPFVLCGTMFLLRTNCGAELRRHRLFETNWDIGILRCCQHSALLPVISVAGDTPRDCAKYMQKYPAGTVVGHQAQHAPQYGQPKVISISGHSSDNPATVNHGKKTRTVSVTGSTPQQNVERNVIRETFPVSAAREAMGIDWMTMKGLSQAIPPAYTKFIGERLMQILVDG